MRVLGLDIETTGLNTAEDHIIEIGACVWDVENKTPLEVYSTFVLPPAHKLPLSDEIRRVTGIKDEWLLAHGRALDQAFGYIETVLMKGHDVDYVVAHNGENFDKPIVRLELERIGLLDHPLRRLHWIDPRSDLPFEHEPKSRSLVTLCAEHGFLNPFPHRALFDTISMMKLMSMYDFEKIVELSKTPWVLTRALVGYDDRQKAKDMRFSWEKIGEITYPKQWVKKIKENKLAAEIAEADAKGFKIVRIE